MDEQPVLRLEPFAPACGLTRRTRCRRCEIRRDDEREGILEAMGDTHGWRQPSRRAEDGEVEFVCFELCEKCMARLMHNVEPDIGSSFALRGEETGQI